MQNVIKWSLLAAFGAVALPAQAQHSDIVFDVDGGQLVIESEEHAHEEDHGMGHDDDDHGAGHEEHEGGLLTWENQWLFEADFSDFEGGPFATDDPGFATHEETGVLTPGELIGFDAIGTLKFWDWDDGSATGSWITSTDASVSIMDVLNAETIIDQFGVTDGSSAFIDAADPLGGLHSHVDFSINSDAEVGAYMIELALTGFDSTGTSEIYTPSDSFLIAFNNGLTEEAYEAGIDAAVVPIPAAAWLFLTGLSVLGARAKKSMRAKLQA